MADDRLTIADLTFRADKATGVSFKKLFRWVIWQFPRPHKNRFLGAVHPPIPEHGWLPALIDAKKQRVSIHGHVAQPFETPEAAVEWLVDQQEKPPAKGRSSK